MNLNNGERVEVALSDFAGTAGLSFSGGAARLAYLPNGGSPVRVGSVIEAGGRTWTVTDRSPSQFLRKWVVLTLGEQ